MSRPTVQEAARDAALKLHAASIALDDDYSLSNEADVSDLKATLLAAASALERLLEAQYS